MFEKQKRVDGYRLRQTEHSVIIDERRGLILSIFDLIFGLVFMAPLCFLGGFFLVKNSVLGIFPIIWHIPVGHWLIILPILCMILAFAFIGFFQAFARSHIEAADEYVLTGNTWFGVPVKLTTTPVSEITAIKLDWERQGFLGGVWCCVGSILSAKNKKSVQLFSCSKKEAALELANAVAEITKLPVQDIPQP
jgi:hypothetical protein